MPWKETASTVRSMIRLGRRSDLSFLAGSIAFFGFFSMIPALILAVTLGSIVGGEAFAEQIAGLVDAYLSAEGSDLVSGALTDPAGMIGASLVGVVALLWSTLKVFRAIDIAFHRVYGAEGGPDLSQQLVNATTVVLTVGAGILLLFGVQWLVSLVAPGADGTAGVLRLGTLLAGLFVLLSPLYYIMPPRRITVREALPGTVTAVVGVIVLQEGFRIYTSVLGQYSAYGVLGVVLLFLLWLYFGALVLLFGAVINVVLEG